MEQNTEDRWSQGITVKSLAKSLGRSEATIRNFINQHQDELDGHLMREGSHRYISDAAALYIENAICPRPTPPNPNISREECASHFQYLRNLAGLTLEQMADGMQYNIQKLRKYDAGETDPNKAPYRFRFILADILHCDVNDLDEGHVALFGGFSQTFQETIKRNNPQPNQAVDERMKDCASYLIAEAFAELEGDPDWASTVPEWRDRAHTCLQKFGASQREVIREAATWVADEIRNGLYGEKHNCYDVINNDGPYPLDITRLMDPQVSSYNMPSYEMRDLWKSMVQNYEYEIYGFTNWDGDMTRREMCNKHKVYIGTFKPSLDAQIAAGASKGKTSSQNNDRTGHAKPQGR